MNEGPSLTAGEPCETDTTGKKITCSYDENGTDPVADFTAMDPEGQDIEWDLDNPKGSVVDDAGKFTIDGGVLEFKKSPNFEDTPSYKVTVRATEVLGEDDAGPAEYTEVTVTVNIEDLDEDGKITFDYKRPQEGVVGRRVSQIRTAKSQSLGNGLCRRSRGLCSTTINTGKTLLMTAPEPRLPTYRR